MDCVTNVITFAAFLVMLFIKFTEANKGLNTFYNL